MRHTDKPVYPLLHNVVKHCIYIYILLTKFNKQKSFKIYFTTTTQLFLVVTNTYDAEIQCAPKLQF